MELALIYTRAREDNHPRSICNHVTNLATITVYMLN